jgi:hypothetical protein
MAKNRSAFLFTLFTLVSSYPALAINNCEAFYASKTIEELVTEKFQNHLAKDGRGSPLLALDRFIELEIKPMMIKYNQQLEIAGREGIDSALTSKFRVLEAALSTAQSALADLQTRYELEKNGKKPQGRGWRVWKSTKAQPETSDLINSFKRCRSSLAQCTLDLETALNNAAENFVAIEKLIEDLKQFTQILEGLVTGMPDNPNKDFMLQIVSQKANKILGSISTLEASANLERTRTVLALNLLRSEIPDFNEKVEIAIVKMRGTEKFKDIDKAEIIETVKPGEIKTASESVIENPYLAGILGTNTPERTASILGQIFTTVAQQGKTPVFSASDALILLQRAKFESINRLAGNVPVSLFSPASHEYHLVALSLDYRNLIALQILKMTQNPPQAIPGSPSYLKTVADNKKLVVEISKFISLARPITEWSTYANQPNIGLKIETEFQKTIAKEIERLTQDPKITF